MKVERFGCGLIEVKFAETDTATKAGTFSGYGAVFGNVDSYGDSIKKGAFKESLREWGKKKKLPPMLLQHGSWLNADDMVPVGKWTSMEEDDTGLKVEGELFGLSTERGTYIYEGMKAGVLDGLSIGYIAREVAYGKNPDDPPRTLKKIDLYECSIVTFPANGEARVDAVKSSLDNITERDFERWLMRDAGLSRSEAIVVINDGFKALQRAKRDAGRADEQVLADITRSAKQVINDLTRR